MTRKAGEFGAWLENARAVLRGQWEADVPCDGCVGCCVSSYPIPLRPSDEVALARVPDRYLQWSSAACGNARMGFREDGSCPMLEGRCCTIYAHRPRTCRDYDCRIYAAAGTIPDGDRPVIQERVREWDFQFADTQSREQAAAVQRAAQFIQAHAALFPARFRARSATAVSVLAVKVYALFMADASGEATPAGRVQEIVEAARRFDAGA